MGIELYWDNDARTVMLCEFERTWTWEELDAVLIKIKRVTDQAEQVIAAIIDVQQGVNFPGGTIFSPGALNQAKKILRMGEGGSGPVIIVGANPLIRTAYNTMRALDPNHLSNVAFADSLEAARAMLIRQRYAYASSD